MVNELVEHSQHSQLSAIRDVILATMATRAAKDLSARLHATQVAKLLN